MNKNQKLFLLFSLIAASTLFLYLVEWNKKETVTFVPGNTTSVVKTVEQNNELSNIVRIGDVAPPFTTQNLAGEDISLSDYSGKIVILNFWATWCPPCRHEMPVFQTIHEQYQEQGVEILALNINETAAEIEDFFYTQFNFSFTPLHDWNAQISTRYNAFNLPTTVVIGVDGSISAIHRGPISQEQLEAYLAPLLP